MPLPPFPTQIKWNVFIQSAGSLKNSSYSLSGASSPIAGRSSNATYTAVANVPASPSSTLQATLTLTANLISPVMVRLSWGDMAQETSYSLKRDGSSLTSLPKDTTSYDDKGLNPETTYNYEFLAYANGSIIASATTSITTAKSAAKFIPYHNLFYPNKAEKVSVYYELDGASSVKISIYDLKGRLVKRLVDEGKPQGKYWIEWDGRNDDGEMASAATYIIQINAGNLKEAKKIILVR